MPWPALLPGLCQQRPGYGEATANGQCLGLVHVPWFRRWYLRMSPSFCSAPSPLQAPWFRRWRSPYLRMSPGACSSPPAGIMVLKVLHRPVSPLPGTCIPSPRHLYPLPSAPALALPSFPGGQGASMRMPPLMGSAKPAEPNQHLEPHRTFLAATTHDNQAGAGHTLRPRTTHMATPGRMEGYHASVKLLLMPRLPLVAAAPVVSEH